VFERQLKADEHGGIDGEWTIPARATLGRYSIFLLLYGSHIDGRGTFRVEEYKKPEFEVVVEVPTEPVRLGEKITATLRARYYFGAPVTDARVRYQVTRSSYMADWWPSGRWDWLYGPGYWCYAPAYDWYPGWRRWSSRLLTTTVPAGGWWWDDRLYGVPEVVLDTEVEIGPDGSVAIEFDTALAKKLHDDRDHRYEITAEVIDRSRRTVTGSGEVLVARDPFQVFAWLDRGYCRAGDTVRASFQARTLDHQPVKGEGRLTLLRVTYPDGKPVETEIESWDLPTNDRGETSLPITAAEAGQYRLSYHVTDQQGRTVEGGYLFHVIGEGFDGRGFRYNDLELVVEKPEYRPGETLRLLINTNRPDSTVLLFVRPVEGIYQPAEVLRLKGKSTVHEIEVTRADMPNFFIEACTVSDGQFHWDIREVVVPPEQQVVNVEVLPSSGEYKPGEEAKLRVKLTDAAGKPFNGSTVLTVYDKSLEAIAGGPNVKDIRQVFWDWLREHYSIAPEDVSTLVHDSFPLVREGQVEMEDLGVFGLLLFPPDQAQRQDELSQFSPMATEHAMMGMGGMGMGGMGGSNSFPTNLSMVVRDRPSPNGHTARDSSRLVEPSLRTEMADTAYWAANLTPDENGIVEVAFPVPENLTTWKVRAWTLGSGTRVGQGESEIITTKNLLVRMQAPRFFMEQDEVVLSANVHNYLNEAKQARVLMELEGDLLMPLDSLERSVRVAADGEQRIDWRVRATRAGEAVVRMKVMTDEESDGMEMRFPVHVHGMLKTDSFTGVIRPDEESAVIEVAVPEERRADETRLEVRYSPTLAGAMVDALPYLVDYPYGCTEQTLNRFLPTVITQGVLRRMGVDLAAIREKQTNLNPRELGDPRQRAGQWRRWPKQNPVFDEAEVERMVIVGIQRLTEMQVGDGGWGWFSGFGEHSYPHTTAVVVYGLQTAKECGVEFDMQVLKEGLDWLMTYQTEQVRLLKNAELPANTRQTQRFKSHADNIDAFVYMVLIDAGHVDGDMERYLYRDRTKLSPYAMAMFGLALHRQENEEKLAMVLRNLEQFLVEDDENQTAYLRLPSESWWWRWYGHSVEANAFYLKLLVRTDPQDRRASRLVKYLLNNRKNGRYWTSTRDTAYAIEALAEYLDASDEMRAEMVVEVWFDGEKQQEVKIDAGNLFDFDNQWLALGDAVPSGVRRVELRRRGIGPLYYNA
jgi:alpha-2-macroglobulin